jgi:tRNA(Ile)-lysidine synthase
VTGPAPLDDAGFARRMAAFEPFEPAPWIAVAVSGGPDSLALTLLADRWARARGGAVLALTIDHGLRPEAAAEARWVGEVLGNRGIAHQVLTWQGDRPDRVRQQHARTERYARLRAVCAEAGVLHLALGHHAEDRAETVLLRVAADSDVDGLAGMAHQREMPELRLLRPLLDCSKAALEATVAAYGLDWVRDPSNRNPGHRRVQLRGAMPALAASGLTPARVNAMAAALGTARQTLEAAQDRLLARAAWLHPAGYAELDPAAFAAVHPAVGRRALGRVLLAVGGRIYPPRGVALGRLYGELADGLSAARTLGGCQVIPRRGRVLVVREWETVTPQPIAPGEAALFDGRVEVAAAAHAPAGLRLAPIGREAWAHMTQARPALRDHPLPPPVRPALTGLFDGDGLGFVPALSGLDWRGKGWLRRWRPAPRRPLTGGGFTVAQDASHTI